MTRLLPLLLSVLSFSFATSPAETPRTPMAPFSPLETALVRVAHLAPAVPAVEVFFLVDGHEHLVLNATYGEVSHYIELPEGQYDVVISDGETAARLVEATVQLGAGYSHTLSVSATDAAGYALTRYEDHFPLFPVDTAGLRVIHAATGLGAVDIYVANERVFSELEPYQDSDYEAFAPGELALELRQVGTEVSLGVFTVVLEAASFHTLFVFGEGGSELVLSSERPVARAD